MAKIIGYLKSLVADPLFVRVCMVLWGSPFLALGLLVAAQWRPTGLWEWLGFALVAAVGLLGGFLCYTGFFGSRKRLERATDFLADGGDIVGAVFAVVVVLFAIPITLLLRAAGAGRE